MILIFPYLFVVTLCTRFFHRLEPEKLLLNQVRFREYYSIYNNNINNNNIITRKITIMIMIMIITIEMIIIENSIFIVIYRVKYIIKNYWNLKLLL